MPGLAGHDAALRAVFADIAILAGQRVVREVDVAIILAIELEAAAHRQIRRRLQHDAAIEYRRVDAHVGGFPRQRGGRVPVGAVVQERILRTRLQAAAEADAEHALAGDRRDQRVVLRHAAAGCGQRQLAVHRQLARECGLEIVVIVVGFSRKLAGRQRRRDRARHDRVQGKRRLVGEARVTIAVERADVAEIHAPDRSCEADAAVEVDRRIVDRLDRFQHAAVGRKWIIEEERSAERARAGALLVGHVCIRAPLRRQIHAVTETLLFALHRQCAFGGRGRDRGDLGRRAAAGNERTGQGQHVRADPVPDRLGIVAEHIRQIADERLDLVAAGATEYGLVILVVVAEPARAHVRVGTVRGSFESSYRAGRGSSRCPSRHSGSTSRSRSSPPVPSRPSCSTP